MKLAWKEEDGRLQASPAKKNVCGTCGNGASARLLDNLKDDQEERPTPKRLPPKRKSKREKTQEWARSVLQRYK